MMLWQITIAQSNFKDRLPNFKDEWIATFGYNDNSFSQIWEFQEDSILIIKRGNQYKEVEVYTWRIEKSIFQILEDEEVILELWFHQIKENYLFLQGVINSPITLVRKSSVSNSSKSEIKNIKSLLDKRCFKLATNIDSFEWEFADIHIDSAKDIAFFNSRHCILFNELMIVRNPYLNILVLSSLGEFEIQAINDSIFLSISLANQQDSIFFIEISKPDNLLDSLSFPLVLQEVQSDLLNSKRRFISVGMPHFTLTDLNGGSVTIADKEYNIRWDYWSNNTIQIKAYRKREVEKTEKFGKFGKLTLTRIMGSAGRRRPDYEFILVISKLENGEFILSSSDCNGTIYQVLDN